MGIFVLVIGAIGGTYLGFGRTGDPVDVAQVSPPGVLAADAARQEAVAAAQQKAAKAAVEAAARAKKANDIAQRAAEEASRSQDRTAMYPVPSSCNEYTGNRALGCALLLEAKFGLDQMPCLDKLWTKESGWNPKAENKSSGAYGIPQALPGTKMAEFGTDWRTNPITQIKWGLSYITNRYQTPCKAWSHSMAIGWY